MAVSTQLSLISPTDEAMSVSQFNAAVKRMVQGQIPALWLRGEVVGLKPHPKGHWYFSLRDGEAQVRLDGGWGIRGGVAVAEGSMNFQAIANLRQLDMRGNAAVLLRLSASTPYRQCP